jgi:hypothetical protein
MPASLYGQPYCLPACTTEAVQLLSRRSVGDGEIQIFCTFLYLDPVRQDDRGRCRTVPNPTTRIVSHNGNAIKEAFLLGFRPSTGVVRRSESCVAVRYSGSGGNALIRYDLSSAQLLNSTLLYDHS